MKLEINQTHNQMVQESFNHHISDIVDFIVTDLDVELTSDPVVFNNEHHIIRIPEKRIFTYGGYTKSGKRFKLIIDE